MKINIPTKITIVRIVGVVALLAFYFAAWISGLNGASWAGAQLGNSGIYVVNLVGCIVFVVAAATDALDGYLARKWHQVTTLGKFLDPIADKMLVNSSLVLLAVSMPFYVNYAAMSSRPHTLADTQTLIPWICVVLMILRDLVVDTMRFVAASKGQVVAANIFGKLKTIFQMVALPLVFLNGWPFSYFDGSWHPELRVCMWFVYLATLMSLISGVIYVIQNRHVLVDEVKDGK